MWGIERDEFSGFAQENFLDKLVRSEVFCGFIENFSDRFIAFRKSKDKAFRPNLPNEENECVAGPLGFEPRLRDPQSRVLSTGPRALLL